MLRTIKKKWEEKKSFSTFRTGSGVLRVACCEWSAAAPGLKPLRLPRARVAVCINTCYRVHRYITL